VKHLAAQAAINTHLSQPIGACVFDGQQGMSVAIASSVVDADMTFAIPAMDASEVVPATTGRKTEPGRALRS